MKNNFLKLALFLFVLASCGTKVTDFSQLQDRNGLFFLINSDKPFSGKVVSRNQGVIEFEGVFKNGIKDNMWVYYHPNGQKKTEGVYVDGAKDGQWPIWKDNGELDYYEIYKFGTLVTDNQVKDGTETNANGEVENKDGEQSETTQNNQTTQTTERTEENQTPYVDWERLRGGSRKTLNGTPYTGGFVQYFPNRTRKLVGHYNNGYRSGKWTYYNKNGTIKDVRYY
ncbi:MAG: hypothetical protein PHT69_14925 [Bacteroidales bacterium]|nr:hypothetical protein [Bacteroidales bacterium]